MTNPRQCYNLQTQKDSISLQSTPEKLCGPNAIVFLKLIPSTADDILLEQYRTVCNTRAQEFITNNLIQRYNSSASESEDLTWAAEALGLPTTQPLLPPFNKHADQTQVSLFPTYNLDLYLHFNICSDLIASYL